MELNRGRIWVEMVPSCSINLFKVKQASKPLQMGGLRIQLSLCVMERNGHHRLKVICDASVWVKMGYSRLVGINMLKAREAHGDK